MPWCQAHAALGGSIQTSFNPTSGGVHKDDIFYVTMVGGGLEFGYQLSLMEFFLLLLHYYYINYNYIIILTILTTYYYITILLLFYYYINYIL
jgi:hypothetical protein